MEDLRYDIELVAFFLSTLAIFILSMLNKLELHLCDNLFGIVIAFITIIIVIAVGCCCCLQLLVVFIVTSAKQFNISISI